VWVECGRLLFLWEASNAILLLWLPNKGADTRLEKPWRYDQQNNT
jgi:hypothetical protein